MSRDIASSQLAVPVGVVLFSGSVSLNCFFEIERYSWGIIIVYAYLTLSFLGIIVFDIWRRVGQRSRSQRVRFGRIWRRTGLVWHTIGAISVVLATWLLSQTTSAFAVNDRFQDLFSTYVATFGLYGFTPIATDSFAALASRDTNKGRFLKTMLRAPRGFAALWFIIYITTGMVLYNYAGNASYDEISVDGATIPHTAWAVGIGSLTAAFKMLIFLRSQNNKPAN